MNRDGRLHLIAWTCSILFHCALISFGAYFLVKPATFTVTAGETSTEIELTMTLSERQPTPSPTPPLPQPPSPLPPLLRPVSEAIEPVPEAELVPTPPKVASVSSTPNSVPVSRPTPSSALVKPQPAAKGNAAESSNASKGAIKAVPDQIHNDPPEYPDESRAAGEQGVVILQVEVSAMGNALSVHILKSSGYFRLDQAARRTVGHWRFHPGIAAGIPVSSEANVPVRFALQ
jgi:protein TonB